MSDLYIVVNISRRAEYAQALGEFDVMPGESPRTYPSLEAAVGCLAGLVLEYEHTVDSAPIYRLVAVPDEEVEPLLEKKLAELKEWND